MSVFANSAATAAGPQADTYAASVIRALGDRDPLAVMREMPDALAAIVRDVPSNLLGKPELNVNDALEEFSALRRSNVRLFERASDEDLARIGMHSERGEESLGYMLRLYAGHDIVHLRQIERIRQAVGAA